MSGKQSWEMIGCHRVLAEKKIGALVRLGFPCEPRVGRSTGAAGAVYRIPRCRLLLFTPVPLASWHPLLVSHKNPHLRSSFAPCLTRAKPLAPLGLVQSHIPARSALQNDSEIVIYDVLRNFQIACTGREGYQWPPRPSVIFALDVVVPFVAMGHCTRRAQRAPHDPSQPGSIDDTSRRILFHDRMDVRRSRSPPCPFFLFLSRDR